MSVIRSDAKIVTLVNVFTVEPEKQERLVNLLIDATEQTMKHMPGFISANIHRSFDGKKVINYAQWKTPKDFENMTKHPDAAPHMKAAAAIAQFEPILCEVVDSVCVQQGSTATAALA